MSRAIMGEKGFFSCVIEDEQSIVSGRKLGGRLERLEEDRWGTTKGEKQKHTIVVDERNRRRRRVTSLRSIEAEAHKIVRSDKRGRADAAFRNRARSSSSRNQSMPFLDRFVR